MRERRRQVTRARGRQRRSRAVWLLGLVAAVMVGYWVLSGPLLSVRSVQVSGYDRHDLPALEQALTDAGRTGTVMSPPVTAIERAADRFPWVASLRVERKLPTGLVVRVVQARPVAIASAGGLTPLLVTSTGRMLGQPAGDDALPSLEANPADLKVGGRLPDEAMDLLVFATELDSELAPQVRGLVRTEQGAVVGRIDAGPEIRLGTSERMVAKARALSMVWAYLAVEERQQATYIDVSVPESPAVGGVAVETEDMADPESLPSEEVEVPEATEGTVVQESDVLGDVAVQ